MRQAYIIDACRTPRALGKPGKGAFSGIHPQHLAGTVLRAIAERNDLTTADVDDVIWGTTAQNRYAGQLYRPHGCARCGYNPRASGLTLNRFCGSGITAVALAAAQIMADMEDLVIAGGTEMNSVLAENAVAGQVPMIDAGNMHLRKLHPQSHQGLCADAIASMEGISREKLDAIGLASQRLADVAIREGRFARSLIPVYRVDGSLALDRDEYPRPDTTAEGLAALKPSFAQIADFPVDELGNTFRSLILQRCPDLKIQFFHHAGSSSGLVDGAAAVLLASPDYARAHGLKPRARVVASANVGDDPTLMLNGPVPAARKVLRRAGLTVDDIDLFEVNEAFAVVVEKFIRDMGVKRDKVNVNGGAIALGHPIGATGAIMIGTVLDELERRDLKRALVTMCAAGGMAPAIIIERV